MSDLTATNCGCGCENGNGMSSAETDLAETDAAMTAACGSSFSSAAAVDSEITAADADLPVYCSFRDKLPDKK